MRSLSVLAVCALALTGCDEGMSGGGFDAEAYEFDGGVYVSASGGAYRVENAGAGKLSVMRVKRGASGDLIERFLAGAKPSDDGATLIVYSKKQDAYGLGENCFVAGADDGKSIALCLSTFVDGLAADDYGYDLDALAMFDPSKGASGNGGVQFLNPEGIPIGEPGEY